MEPKEMDIIKVQQFFHRLSNDKSRFCCLHKIGFELLFDSPEKYYSESNNRATPKLVERTATNQMWIVLQA